jgi:acyl carrier protein
VRAGGLQKSRGARQRRPPDASHLTDHGKAGSKTEEQSRMNTDEIRAAVKQSIANIANLDAGEIGDDASFKEELQLDSLTILEIAVDAEYKFQVKIPDDELSNILTVGDTVRIVQQYLSSPATAAA